MPVRTADDPLALRAVDDPESVPDAVVITDVRGRITAVNRAFTALHGYAPREVVGRRPGLLSSGLHPARMIRQLWATIAAGRSWAGELVDRASDGTLRTIRSTITPVRGPEGAISHFVALQRELPGAAPDRADGGVDQAAYGRVRLDTTGQCTFADRPSAELFRADGDPVRLLGSGLVSGLHLDDAATLREVIDQVVRTARDHRLDLEGVRGYVRCVVRLDPSSRSLTDGPIADIACEPFER